jgi:type IV secretion system protein VirB6
MACPAVTTGNEFLVSALAHLDCQAQTLGSFGFQALAAPGSPAASILTALLTLFVAIYGIRLLFGQGGEPRDIVTAVLKIGIVLTLAVSWPAWRTLAYDTVLRGPAELAASMMPGTLPDPGTGFPERLQGIDGGIAAFTAMGTGRQTAEVLDEGPASGFRPIALEDETGLGWARTIYLAATLGPLAVLRIGGGLLLALAPLFAGLLLFDTSRGFFAGWLRGLALVALGSLGITVLLSVEVALIEPWLADVLERRALGYATPTAPTELLALVIAFALASAGLLFLLTRVAFQNAWAMQREIVTRIAGGIGSREREPLPAGSFSAIPVHSRAAAIGESVALSVRREELISQGTDPVRRIGFTSSDRTPTAAAERAPATPAPLGSTYRRTARHESRSQARRDHRQ